MNPCSRQPLLRDRHHSIYVTLSDSVRRLRRAGTPPTTCFAHQFSSLTGAGSLGFGGMAREKSRVRCGKKTAMNFEMTVDSAVVDKAGAVEVLAELYELLEEYGPTWYSEELHHRAEAALRILRESRD